VSAEVGTNHLHNSSVISNAVLYDTNHFVLIGGYVYQFEEPYIMLYKTDTFPDLSAPLEEKNIGIINQLITVMKS
jgi:hypothetical protein